MARSVRVEFADAVYHVTARGNERKAIYRDDADRQRFLETVEQAVERFGVVVHAYCLMPNYYDLLLQTPRANLSAAVGWLQTSYSIRLNRRHRRTGHLYQGRFKAHVVEDYGYRDGSGVHRVIQRPEEAAKTDAPLAHRLKTLVQHVSSVKR